MPYVQSWTNLRGHPKLSRLRTLLGQHGYGAWPDDGGRPTVALTVGWLHLLWHWTLEYAPTGDLTTYTTQELADAAEWPGDPDAWVAALTKAGFLDDGPDDKRQVHDWRQYAGELLRKREARATERAARPTDETQKFSREKARPEPPVGPTPPDPRQPHLRRLGPANEPAGFAGIRALRETRGRKEPPK